MLRRSLNQKLQSEDGNASVEFVVLFPLIFALFVTSVDFSIQMLRQASLDRAVDIVMRDVRLGRSRTADDIKLAICAVSGEFSGNQADCFSNITVELRPVQPSELRLEDPSVRCVDRASGINPVLAFTPRIQGQELMMVRVCRVASPFIALNGFLLGNPRGPNDDFMSVSVGFFVNEPE